MKLINYKMKNINYKEEAMMKLRKNWGSEAQFFPKHNHNSHKTYVSTQIPHIAT